MASPTLCSIGALIFIHARCTFCNRMHWELSETTPQALPEASLPASSLQLDVGAPRFDASDFNAGLRSFIKSTPRYNDVQECSVRNGTAWLDLRGCWEDLEDYEGRPVCGDDVMEELLGEANILKSYKEKGNAGASGATLVALPRSFIIKSVDGEEEYTLILKTIPRIHVDIQIRREVYPNACWSTGLAPMCAVIAAGGHQWLLMRKIDIPVPVDGITKGTLLNGKHMLKAFDLKGPTWGSWDGKAIVDANALLTKQNMVKDHHFQEFFEHGIEMEHCGFRDSARMLMLDSMVLMRTQMTDYSLFGTVYSTSGRFNTSRCWCEESSRPKFPIILQSTQTHNLRLAVGIIDYIEQHIASSLAVFSSMQPPVEFRDLWSKMWPYYFKDKPRRFSYHVGRISTQSVGTLAGEPDAPAEMFKIGQYVVALELIKWVDPDRSHNRKKSIERVDKQIDAWDTGSDHKVPAGTAGVVRAFDGPTTEPYMYVQFGDLLGIEFKVWPKQVMGIPKIGKLSKSIAGNADTVEPVAADASRMPKRFRRQNALTSSIRSKKKRHKLAAGSPKKKGIAKK